MSLDPRTCVGRTGIAACALALLSSAAAYPQEITVIDDQSVTVLTDGQPGVIDFGCTRPGFPVSRSFTVQNVGSETLILAADGLSLPPGYSLNPPWPSALVRPEIKVSAKRGLSAGHRNLILVELTNLPSDLSVQDVTISIPDSEPANPNTPPSQFPFIDSDHDIPIARGLTTLLDTDPVTTRIRETWRCPTPDTQSNPNGDICTEFRDQIVHANRSDRWKSAIVRMTPGVLTENGKLGFELTIKNLHPPFLPPGGRRTENAESSGGHNASADRFGIAGIEVSLTLFNSDTNTAEVLSGRFVDDGVDDNCSTVTLFGGSAVEGPAPIRLDPGQGFPFTVQLDAVEEGIFAGPWSLENNDADENPFDFPIRGIVDGTPPTFNNLPGDLVVPAVEGTCKAVVDWTAPTASDNSGLAITVAQSMGPAPGATFSVGAYVIEYTATDCAGNEAREAFAVHVTDQVPPSLSAVPKRIIANAAPGDSSVIVNFAGLGAIDDCDPNVMVVCTPESGSEFNVGVTQVCCVARDSSGNESSQACFEVIVVQVQPTPSRRTGEIVTERNRPAPGVPGALMNTVTHAFLNEDGAVAIEGTMRNAGLDNIAVWTDVGSGLELVSRKGDIVPGVGLPISRYDDVVLNDSGELGLEIFISGATTTTDALHGSDASGTLEVSLREGGTAPGTSAVFSQLHEPAFDGLGATVSPALLLRGTGGVDPTNDTGIWRKPSGGPLTEVLREGFAVGSAIPNALCGQIGPRVVANVDGHMAVYLLLAIGPGGVTAFDNTAILSGPEGNLSVVAREGMSAPDSNGAEFQTFAAEAISTTGRVAFETGLKRGSGPILTTGNNAGLYTNSNGPLELVAREGDLAPCLEGPGGSFSSFREIFIAENGDVFFHAFLTGPAVDSDNDGSFWRWRASDATLHPLLREGDTAPSTQGAVFNSLLEFAASDDGLHAITATLVPGIGDCDEENNYGLWLDDLTNGLPILHIREGDLLDLGLAEDTSPTVFAIDTTNNFVGGSGGHGKVLNDAGEIITKVSFDLNTSGVIILGGSQSP